MILYELKYKLNNKDFTTAIYYDDKISCDNAVKKYCNKDSRVFYCQKIEKERIIGFRSIQNQESELLTDRIIDLEKV